MNKKAIVSVSLLSLISTTSLWADDNHCSRLQIQLANGTNVLCRLAKYKVVHGNLTSVPPGVIRPGHMESFDIHQTIYGPEIVLIYNCNEQYISFSSRQNLCFLEAGNVSGNVISKDIYINANYTFQNGSYHYSKPGLINWILTT